MISIFKKCGEYTLAKEAIAQGIYPYFHELESRPDTEVIMDGKRQIMMGSNNYLSLTTHPEVIEASIKATEKYGTGCSGSRFLNGTLDLHNQLEEELAAFMRAEAALTFSTGFQSNLGIITAIVDKNAFILSDEENHASIIDACRLTKAKIVVYKHSDMGDLEEKLKAIPLEADKLLVTDGVFSMSGDICKLPEIVALAKQYNCATMVDDAHGFGVIGEGGRGTASHFGLEGQVDLIMGTFSKSLASLGGYVVANQEIIHYIKHNSRPFIFSASIPPASCAAALAALRVIVKEPQRVRRLNDLAGYMRDGLTSRGVKIKEGTTPIIPFFTYDMVSTLVTNKYLFEAGVYVNPVLPPAVPSAECMLRCSLMADHTEALIDEACEIISQVTQKVAAAKAAGMFDKFQL